MNNLSSALKDQLVNGVKEIIGLLWESQQQINKVE